MEELFKKFNYKDDVGNELKIKSDGSLILKLIAEGRTRPIGTINYIEDDLILYCKHVNEDNIFRTNNSWGINWHVLSNLSDHNIIIQYGKLRNYYITVKEAKKYGSFLHFKNQGLEKQYFIPIKFWKSNQEELNNEIIEEKKEREKSSVTDFLV